MKNEKSKFRAEQKDGGESDRESGRSHISLTAAEGNDDGLVCSLFVCV